jgi:hypothetical protein
MSAGSTQASADRVTEVAKPTTVSDLAGPLRPVPGLHGDVVDRAVRRRASGQRLGERQRLAAARPSGHRGPHRHLGERPGHRADLRQPGGGGQFGLRGPGRVDGHREVRAALSRERLVERPVGRHDQGHGQHAAGGGDEHHQGDHRRLHSMPGQPGRHRAGHRSRPHDRTLPSTSVTTRWA